MSLTKNDIVVGKFYINSTESKIRQVIAWTKTGKVIWRGFWLASGEMFRGRPCSLNVMLNWAAREATADEISQLKIQETEEAELDHSIRQIKYYLSIASNKMLIDELKGRRDMSVDNEE